MAENKMKKLENTGERQVSPTIDGIRRDHVARYEFAAKIIPPGSKIIDYACGIGYGSKIIRDSGNYCHGFDKDFETLEFADEHYKNERVFFTQDDAERPKITEQYDCAVCFETIEHLQDPRPLLLALRDASPKLICSVPNEDVFPFEYALGKTIK
jgi:2-polyprenyl-3-methyl-5-hydroxy-6-metoxy-1,4-benzoquinol methylase